jgi:hypothetical protein
MYVDAHIRSAALVFLNYGADATLGEISAGLKRMADQFEQAAIDEATAGSRVAIENFERAQRQLDEAEAQAANDRASARVIAELQKRQRGET